MFFVVLSVLDFLLFLGFKDCFSFGILSVCCVCVEEGARERKRRGFKNFLLGGERTRKGQIGNREN